MKIELTPIQALVTIDCLEHGITSEYLCDIDRMDAYDVVEKIKQAKEIFKK